MQRLRQVTLAVATLLLLAVSAAAQTGLNRTTVVLLTNKSGGSVNYGDVVIVDNTNASSFTTTTTAALSTRGLGVVLDVGGIANNAVGSIAVGGYVPKVNLNTAATVGQLLKTHTVAGQATPHSSPQVEGDFGVALEASTSPKALLFGSPNGPGSGGTTLTDSASLRSALSDEVGTGAAYFVGGALGTPASATLTNATGLPLSGITGNKLTFGIVIDGGGSAITTGVKGFIRIPLNATVTKWTVLSTDASSTSGSIVVDVWKDTYTNYPPTVADTIAASAKPTLSSAAKNEDSTLTGWTTSITAGDVIGFKVDSATTVTRVLVEIEASVP